MLALSCHTKLAKLKKNMLKTCGKYVRQRRTCSKLHPVFSARRMKSWDYLFPVFSSIDRVKSAFPRNLLSPTN